MFDEKTVKDWNTELMSQNALLLRDLPLSMHLDWVAEWVLTWWLIEKRYGK